MFYCYLVYKESTSKKNQVPTLVKKGERREQRENTVSARI